MRLKLKTSLKSKEDSCLDEWCNEFRGNLVSDDGNQIEISNLKEQFSQLYGPFLTNKPPSDNLKSFGSYLDSYIGTGKKYDKSAESSSNIKNLPIERSNEFGYLLRCGIKAKISPVNSENQTGISTDIIDQIVGDVHGLSADGFDNDELLESKKSSALLPTLKLKLKVGSGSPSEKAQKRPRKKRRR